MKLVLLESVIVAFCLFDVVCCAKDNGRKLRKREENEIRIVENGSGESKVDHRVANSGKRNEAIETKTGYKTRKLNKRQADDEEELSEEEWQAQPVYAAPQSPGRKTSVTQLAFVITIVVLACLIAVVGGFVFYMLIRPEESNIEGLVGNQVVVDFYSQQTMAEEPEVEVAYGSERTGSLQAVDAPAAVGSPGGGNSLLEQLTATLSTDKTSKTAPATV